MRSNTDRRIWVSIAKALAIGVVCYLAFVLGNRIADAFDPEIRDPAVSTVIGLVVGYLVSRFSRTSYSWVLALIVAWLPVILWWKLMEEVAKVFREAGCGGARFVVDCPPDYGFLLSMLITSGLVSVATVLVLGRRKKDKPST